jgi:transcriptional regulator with XRE-family HTH domain
MSETNPLRRFRARRKLSQDVLARMIGVSAVTISRWETGARVPDAEFWPAIKEATGIVVSARDFSRRATEAAE